MFLVKVHTFPKAGVLDPQGNAIETAISDFGFDHVERIQTGKYFKVEINTSDMSGAEKIAKELCQKILVNPVLEDYEFEVVEG